jgi:hypothetical protein
MPRSLTLLWMVLWCAAAVATTSAQTKKETPDKEPRAKPVQIEMKNVRLHADEGIILDVRRLLGTMVSQSASPPAIRGRLTQAAITGDALVQTFADGDGRRLTPLKKPAPTARNHIYFGGGDIRFGKLTMSAADLQLIDADPRDPFDFFPAHYNVQLVAGYSKNTPAKGLKTYMPDYEDIRKR